ncbi:MAG: dephospho-CoA kinase [Clostridia bacterium]|nr:dephospho-CoA kinase [Clostridia bacterium]
MKILGITGMTGAGKTTLVRQVEAYGGRALDCDVIYHALLASCEPMLREIQAQFPEAFSGGTLERKALGKIVFADADKLNILNEITHKYVILDVKNELFKAHEDGVALVAVDAIALVESGLGNLCDLTVCVTAPEEVRIARLMAREGISREYASARIRAQKSEEEFCKMCDLRLENNGTREEFERKCQEFLKKLISSTTERKVTL